MNLVELTVDGDHSQETVDRALYTYRDLKLLGVPYSRTSLWRMTQDGRFPKPLQLSERRIAWKASDVHAWINSLEEV